MSIETTTLNSSQTIEPTRSKRLQRKRLFTLLALSVAVSGAGAGSYWEFVASKHVETDNAYTAVESAQMMSSIVGTVAEVKVKNTQAVKKGDILVVIDPSDAMLTLVQAEAELDRAIRRVKSYAGNDAGLRAQVTANAEAEKRLQAQWVSAKADFERAAIDLKRRKALVPSGAISGDELTRIQNIYASAEANLNAANAAVAQAHASKEAAMGSKQANAALIEGVSLDVNPEVALARAKRDQAQLDLERTIIRSPIDGIIARRQVELGQRVQPSAPLLTVVPIQSMYVNANFKEVQLKGVRPGQKVELISDLYGKDVIYHGVVEGFDGGTGAAYSLIPAQNATGNWIKVVQRLPVRVKLDPSELTAHPLRVGLSMTASVDLSDKS
ncbi:MAG: HlyD family efflux transporter periplasmic adaptor subunit [Gammaproteobacteria bacterium]|nr:HlyD family efflux transporter periplasmic adaptor subunit [Gammaproteobacteria bacterium]